MTESQLIERYLQGDKTAVADLVERYATSAFRLALSILDDPTEAEEATQEAWVNALRHLDTYRGEASFQTWLYAITLNICRSRLRKRYQRQRLHEALIAIFQDHQVLQSHAEEDFLHKELGDQVFEAVRRLGENERLTIILRYYQGLAIAQIAQVMQVSERTVYSRLRDAHEHLRAYLENGKGRK